MTVEVIKQAITGLSEAERRSLAAWFHGLDYDDWDRQMAEDFSPRGRGAPWLEKTRKRVAAGEAVVFEEGRAVQARKIE